MYGFNNSFLSAKEAYSKAIAAQKMQDEAELSRLSWVDSLINEAAEAGKTGVIVEHKFTEKQELALTRHCGFKLNDAGMNKTEIDFFHAC